MQVQRAFLEPDQARQSLFDITRSLQGRHGVLCIIEPGEGSQDSISYELATWGLNRKRDRADDLLNATAFVQKQFANAYQPVIDRMPAGPEKKEKQEILDLLLRDFTQTALRKNSQFGKTTMREFFNRAETAFTSEAERLTIADGRAGQEGEFKPRGVFEGVPDIDDFDENGDYHPPVVVPPHQEIPFQPPQSQQLPAEVNLPEQHLNSHPVDPQRNSLLQPPLIQQPAAVRVLPTFTPTKNSSKTALFQSITGLDLSSAKSFSEGGMGEVFDVPSQNGAAPQILKNLKLKGDSNIKNFFIAKDLRNKDGTAVYLQSHSQSIPGLVAATDLFIVACDKKSASQEYHHVPLNNPPEAKKYLRDLQKTNHIAVVGQLMPKAEGRSLDRLDLKGSDPKKGVHRKAIAQQLMTTLHAYTTLGYTDCDIKPDNAIYDTKTMKVQKIDQGLMVKFSKKDSKRLFATGVKGTPSYLAPQKFNNRYGPEVDAYEMAMTLAKIKYGSAFYQSSLNALLRSEAFRERHRPPI